MEFFRKPKPKPTLKNTTETLNNFYLDFEQILEAVKEPINSIPQFYNLYDSNGKFVYDKNKNLRLRKKAWNDFKSKFNKILDDESKILLILKNNVVEYTQNLSLASCPRNIKYDKCQQQKSDIYYGYFFLLKLIRLLEYEIKVAIDVNWSSPNNLFKNQSIYDSIQKMKSKIVNHYNEKDRTIDKKEKNIMREIEITIDKEIKNIKKTYYPKSNQPKYDKIVSFINKWYYNLFKKNSSGGKKTAPKKKPITKKPVKKVTPKKKPITKKPVKKVVPKKKSNVKNLVTKKPATKK